MQMIQRQKICAPQLAQAYIDTEIIQVSAVWIFVLNLKILLVMKSMIFVLRHVQMDTLPRMIQTVDA